MEQLFLELPNDFVEIIDQLIAEDWLFSYFPISREEHYNPANYLLAKEISGTQYKIVLDRNIFRFIISSATSNSPTTKNRSAISLVSFCQAAEIQFEPNLAIYERYLPYKNDIDFSLNELRLFHAIDNAPADELIDFAVSRTNKLYINQENSPSYEDVKEKIQRYDWLANWRSLYLIVLKAVLIDFTLLSSTEKVDALSKWVLRQFRLSLPCMVFCIFLYSSVRMRKMNKVKKNASIDQKLRQLYNMTWDLFFIDKFLHYLLEQSKEYEVIVATDDKATKKVLNAVLHIQRNEDFNALKDFLPQRDHCLISTFLENSNTISNRVYGTNDWNFNHRESLISELENELQLV